MIELRSTGWTIDGDSFMEKSGRQIAEEMFKENNIDCKITKLASDGTCGGNWCFWAEVELDKPNAVKWDVVFG